MRPPNGGTSAKMACSRQPRQPRFLCHCEEQRDDAISTRQDPAERDCFAPLAMTARGDIVTERIFDGLKVIDCASFIAGPAAATVMSDFGADVIKIEPPGSG